MGTAYFGKMEGIFAGRYLPAGGEMAAADAEIP